MSAALQSRSKAASDGALAATYDALWRTGRHALAAGRIEREALPVAGTVRWGISVVLRPRPWSPALVACAAAVAERVGGAGVFYDDRGLHVTLRAIEGYRDDVAPDDADLRAYRDVIGPLVTQLAPLRLRLRGITATPGGVLVQGWPASDLQAFRVALYERLAARGLALRGPETSPGSLRTTAHATLAIFEEPPARAADLIDLVDAHRETDFGEWIFREVWLVGHRRIAGQVALIEYGRCAFGADTAGAALAR